MNSMEAFNSICGDFLQNLRKYADGKTPVRMVDEFARVILDIKLQGINCWNYDYLCFWWTFLIG